MRGTTVTPTASARPATGKSASRVRRPPAARSAGGSGRADPVLGADPSAVTAANTNIPGDMEAACPRCFGWREEHHPQHVRRREAPQPGNGPRARTAARSRGDPQFARVHRPRRSSAPGAVGAHSSSGRADRSDRRHRVHAALGAGPEGARLRLDHLHHSRPELTTVLVTHHLEELPESATHAALIKDGDVLAAGLADEVLTPELVTARFDHPIRIE